MNNQENNRNACERSGFGSCVFNHCHCNSDYTVIDFCPTTPHKRHGSLDFSANRNATNQSVGVGGNISIQGLNQTAEDSSIIFTAPDTITLTKAGTYLITSQIILAAGLSNINYPMEIVFSDGEVRAFNVVYNTIITNGEGNYAGLITIPAAPVSIRLRNASGTLALVDLAELNVIKIA